MILHIPHSSTNTIGDIVHTQSDVNSITDWFTHELYFHEFSERVVFGYTRLDCDVERYRNDEDEAMTKYGRSVVYTKGVRNNTIRKDDTVHSNYIKETYYDAHHKKLNIAINRELSLFGACTIVDCHSFPSDPLSESELDELPDFCIGINTNNVPNCVDEIIGYIESTNHTVKINDPFSGSMIPSKFIGDKKVKTIMIEINKRLYIDDNISKVNFEKYQNIINNVLGIIYKDELENEK